MFPFIKTAHEAEQQDDLIPFETMIVIVSRVCQNWFIKFPQIPVHLMQTSDEIINLEDPELYAHLRNQNFATVHYAWPFFSSLFSETLPYKEWLVFSDHLISNWQNQEFQLYFLGAFLLYYRSTLLGITTQDSMKNFTSRINSINIAKVIKNTYDLIKKYKDSDKVYIFNGGFESTRPINEDHYPVFDSYPVDTIETVHSLKAQITVEEEEKRVKE
jgi:hypothetical protein